MRQEPISITGRTSLTRISVTGKGDHFLVRNGSEDAVKVWVRHDELVCECGRAACSHIESLKMCGFVEPSYEERRAA
jgi:hypothetical protein